MNEIKPNWSIAQQISKRHTFVSLAITLPLFLSSVLIALIVLKIMGVANSGLFLKNYVAEHQKVIWTSAFLIHFIPINYYAIIKVFKASYPNFELKIMTKSPSSDQNIDDNIQKNR
jgi:hypothetical protein